MKILVTGADGFVGSRLVPRLLDQGHEVIAAVRPPGTPGPVDSRARKVDLELNQPASVRAIAGTRPEAVVHLAAISSGSEARRDPGLAWEVNTVGTARLADALVDGNPLFLLISTAEVYGAGPSVPRTETDPAAPCSPYAASKLAAEIAALEIYRRAGLRVVVARAFAHTGAGQDQRFVVPAFAARLRLAKKVSAPAVRVGNLTHVREFLHVDDVVNAYVLLLSRGRPGEIYNVASGRAVTLEELFYLLCDLVGHRAVPEADPSLMRTADIPYLVGDAAKLRAATGWAPRKTLEQTLTEVVRAQTD